MELQMKPTLALLCIFVIALCAVFWIFKKVLKIAVDKNIVDNPDARKLQRVPVPVLGGIAVYWGIVVSLTAAGIIFDLGYLFEAICIMTIMLIVGILDDLLHLSPIVRFLIEILVVLALIFSGGYSIDNFHGVFDIYAIPTYLAIPLTVFASVGIINAINLIDGVNGLCSGYCIFACSAFAILYAYTDSIQWQILAIASVGSIIPFFLHNVFGRKSKMFIGDGGTLLLGVIMSMLLINILKEDSEIMSALPENVGIIPLALAIFAIPVFDTLRVMSLRILKGKSPFQPDKTHLHHLLIDLHFSHVGTTVTEIIANLLIVLIWWISFKLGATIDLQLCVVVVLGIGITFGFYKFVRTQERKQTRIYRMLTKIGDSTHVGHTNWFEWLTKRLDKDC